jgi:SAM-dependent methyltransferase
LGWHYPAAIAETYRDAAITTDTPIADVGCGTGLVASALNLPREQIDGIDISVEMLRVAKEKRLYRSLYKVDLTKSLDVIANDYGAVLSAGTFTSGHLGPEPLESLPNIARQHAIFVIGVKKAFYLEAGFESTRSAPSPPEGERVGVREFKPLNCKTLTLTLSQGERGQEQGV